MMDKSPNWFGIFLS